MLTHGTPHKGNKTGAAHVTPLTYKYENLKRIMPLVRFDESICADERKLLPADGIWDVEATQLKYFETLAQWKFHDLPDKTVFRVTHFLEKKDLVNFVQVSKRMRSIAQSRVDYTNAIKSLYQVRCKK